MWNNKLSREQMRKIIKCDHKVNMPLLLSHSRLVIEYLNLNNEQWYTIATQYAIADSSIFIANTNEPD